MMEAFMISLEPVQVRPKRESLSDRRKNTYQTEERILIKPKIATGGENNPF
jgi:hypothetical protein